MRLDDPNRLESPDEIAVYARAVFSRPSRADGATSAESDLICPVGLNAAVSSPLTQSGPQALGAP